MHLFQTVVGDEMKIIRFTEIEQVPAAHEDPTDPAVLKKVLFRREDLFAGRIQMVNWATLLPGKTVKSHAHESMQEVFIMLTSGIVAVVNSNEIVLFKGDALVVDAKETHEMKNQGIASIDYIVLGIA